MSDLLLHEPDSVEVLGPADQDGVAEQHAVLGAADGDDVGVADRVLGVDVQRGDGVGDPGAVDVNQQVQGVGVVDEVLDGVCGPDAAVLGRLGDGDDPRLRVVDVAAAGDRPGRAPSGRGCRRRWAVG